MSKSRTFGLMLGVAAVAACVPRPAPPPPEPPAAPQPQAPRPQPVPTPPPPPPANWQDAPLSAGSWRYGTQGQASAAAFGPAGQPALVVRCEPSRQVTIARTGDHQASAITLRTTSVARALPAGRQQGALVAALAASDRFLDEIAFSRGRFTVEVAGAPILIVPTWPELARVIEDCRA